MKRTHQNYPDEFSAVRNLMNIWHFSKRFWWKAGKYTVSFLARSPTKVIVMPETFKFRLIQNEIDLLESNMKEIKNPIENVIKGGAAGYIPHPDMFAWLSVSLCKIKQAGILSRLYSMIFKK